MITTGWRRASLAVMLWCVTVAVVFASDVRVTPLVTSGQVFASFSATDSYTRDVQEAVESGLPTTLTFVVELREASVVWWDRTVTTVTICCKQRLD
ncbi:MAG: DUF4390 domain-containing protein [Acidobacteriota bacterium]